MNERRRILRWGVFILITGAFTFGLIHTPFYAKAASGNEYYVAPNGDDSNPGTFEEPWRTLSPVHARDFLPGDVIHFKRGGAWSGGLVIDDSGVEGNPITFTAYGTGNRPIFTNPGGEGHYTKAIEINADWLVVEDFLVQDAHEAGIFISNGSDHNIVRDIEITNVGIGIAIVGRYTLATHNYVHDLHMVVNTSGGNDDYGAIGIGLYNSNNEVSYNRMVNCKAPSYDYGVDGGAVEWFGDADNNYVHHNWAIGVDGFLEVGGGSAKNSVVAYNVSVDNSTFSMMHLSGVFASVINNFRIENNTIVETTINEEQHDFVLIFGGEPTEDTALIRNNIFWIEQRDGGFYAVSNESNFSHEYNIYYLVGLPLGFDLARGEKIVDPLFNNLVGKDFHLQNGSPAIDNGIDLGYSLDFDNLSVPFGAAPDMGAFEYQTVGSTSTPTPSLTPITPTPTLTASPTFLPPSPTHTLLPSPTSTSTLTQAPTFTATPTSIRTLIPSETPSSTPLPSDLNSDGKVDVLDIQICVNVVLGTEIDPVIVVRADVNTDGEVNVLDVQEIVNIMLAI